MSCTAWNSVRASADAPRPSAQPSTASSTATRTTSPIGPATFIPHTQTAKPTMTSAWTAASTANAAA